MNCTCCMSTQLASNVHCLPNRRSAGQVHADDLSGVPAPQQGLQQVVRTVHMHSLRWGVLHGGLLTVPRSVVMLLGTRSVHTPPHVGPLVRWPSSARRILHTQVRTWDCTSNHTVAGALAPHAAGPERMGGVASVAAGPVRPVLGFGNKTARSPSPCGYTTSTSQDWHCVP